MDIFFEVTYANTVAGDADATFSLSIPQGILVTFYYADERAVPLENYASIKSIPLINGVGEYVFKEHRMIPEEAKKIVCKVYNDFMHPIELPELIKDIPQEKQLPKDTPQARIYITSDIHVGGNYFNNVQNRKTAFASMRDAKPDFVLISGDITDNSNPWEFEEAKALIDEYLDGIPVMICTGNHDYSPYAEGAVPHFKEMHDFFVWQCERNKALGVKIEDLNDFNYFCATVNGTQVVVLNGNDVNNHFEIKKEQRDWLDRKLSQTDSARYRFVMSHFHLYGTVGFPPESYQKDLIDDKELSDILTSHQNIVYVSGHTHHNFNSDDRNDLFDGEHNVFHINGGCAVWGNVCMEYRSEYYLKDFCTGQLLEIYGDRMIARGKDFVSGKFIPRCVHMAKM